MQNTLTIADQIHQNALEVATRYKRAEADLVEILQPVEQHRVYLARGHSSLYRYVVDELNLSEGLAYNLINVSRKAREVPELKAEVQNGNITLTNARMIIPVLTPENQTEWLQKASDLSQRELEKEIVKVRPREATREHVSYVTENRVSVELGLSEKDILRLRRVQDLLSQRRKRPVSLEEVVVEMTGEHLEKHDPVERAKRRWVKKGFQNKPEAVCKEVSEESKNVSEESRSDSLKTLVARRVHLKPESENKSKRVRIPSEIMHQVNLRDRRRCAYVNARGERCDSRRWLDVHHKIPVSKGGANGVENLITLCSSHHHWIHS